MSFAVLIVDDSGTTRAIIKRAIGASGLPVDRVIEAPNGAVALSLLASNEVDLVVADLHMPEMDGLEMTRRILADEKTKSIPVVIVSAEPNAQRIAELRQRGIRGYLKKPFTPEALRQVLSEALGVTNG